MSKKVTQFLPDDANDDVGELKVNKAFAEKYNEQQSKALQSKKSSVAGRRKMKDELIVQLEREAMAGDQDESDTESDSEDDDDGDIDPGAISGILDVIQKIRNKDTSVYDPNVKFFDGTVPTSKPSSQGQGQGKKVRVGDVVRQQLLAGEDDEDASDEAGGYVRPTPAEEARQLKADVLAGIRQAEREAAGDAGADADGDDLLVIRKKAKIPKAVKIKNDDDFLRNYVSQQWWKAEGDSASLPSYEEIVGADRAQAIAEPDPVDIDEDDDSLIAADEHERKHNFRFEEPNAAQIASFPRDLADSVRQEEPSKRKRQRESKKTRLEADKLRKQEELKRLKAQKRKEMMQKLQQFGDVAGLLPKHKTSGSGSGSAGSEGAGDGESDDFDESLLSELPLSARDLQGDWDPAAFDSLMQRVFDSEFYAQGEDDEAAIDRIRLADKEQREAEQPGAVLKQAAWQQERYKLRQAEKRQQAEEDGADDEGEGAVSAPVRPLSEKEKQRLLKVAVEKKLEEDLQGFEDRIGEDLYCRFRYAPVEPDSFGLSVVDILNMPDKDLNRRVSVKNVTRPYKNPRFVIGGAGRGAGRGGRGASRGGASMAARGAREESGSGAGDSMPGQTAGQKRKREDSSTPGGTGTLQPAASGEPGAESKSQKRRKRRKSKGPAAATGSE